MANIRKIILLISNYIHSHKQLPCQLFYLYEILSTLNSGHQQHITQERETHAKTKGTSWRSPNFT